MTAIETRELTKRYRRVSALPVCGAPRHQRCRNLAFPQHFTPTHPERGGGQGPGI